MQKNIILLQIHLKISDFSEKYSMTQNGDVESDPQ